MTKHNVNAPVSKRRSPKRIARATEALRLRLTGMTYAQIAEALTCDIKTAYEDVRIGLEVAHIEPAQEQVQLAYHRFERMIMAVWPRVLRGEIDAVKEARAIQTEINKLLGLNAPTRIDVSLFVAAIHQMIVEDGGDPESDEGKMAVAMVEDWLASGNA